MKIMIYIMFFGFFLIVSVVTIAVLIRSFGFLASSFLFMVSKLPVKKTETEIADTAVNTSEPVNEMESIEIEKSV